MVSDKQRHQAVQRALKMNILFKAANYDNIMKALDKPNNDPTRKAEFYAAVPASLNAAEKDWLWNYLQHCHKATDPANPGGYDNVPEAMAASVGW